MTQPVDFLERGPLRRRRSLDIGRERRCRALRERMPYRLMVVPDPILLVDSGGANYLSDDIPNDAGMLTNAIFREYEDGRGHILIGDFNTYNTPHKMAGRTPALEPDVRLDFITPGPLPGSICPSDLAIILEVPDQPVYTVENITLDRIDYIAHLSLHLFSNRQRYVD